MSPRSAPRPLVIAAVTAVALLLTPGRAAAQDTFRSPNVLLGTTVTNPLHMVTGDVNGDGLPDLAAATTLLFGGAGAIVFLNVDGTSFGEGTMYFGGDRDVLLADVDGDGDLDLLAARDVIGSDSVQVRLGVGDGTFAPTPVSYATPDGPGDIHVVDVSADGVPDLVVPCGAAARVAVRLGAGDGTFGALASYGVPGTNAGSVAVADLDEDGHLDLAVLDEWDHHVTVLPGGGDGTFAAPLAPIPVGTSPRYVRAADFDEDGHADLVVVESGSHLVRFLLGDGAGTFPSQTTVGIGTTLEELVVADLDEDGHLDVAATSGSDDAVYVVLGDGTGAFPTVLAFGTGRDPLTVAAADFNRDGDLDLVTGNLLSDDATVLWGGGDGTFAAAYRTGQDPRGSAIADLDGDGRPDLAVANEQSQTIGVLLGQGGGTLRHVVTLTGAPEPVDVVAGDFDGDGIADLLAGSSDSFVDGGYLFAGNGDGTFAAAVPLPLDDDVRFMETADFDGDGALDVAVVHGGTPSLVVYRFDGEGAVLATPLSADPNDYDLAVGDLDGDELPDIALSRSGAGPSLAVIRNAGGGSFDAPVLHDVGPSNAKGLTLADVDGDGDLDVAVADGSLFDVLVILGHGDGTFGAETVLDVGANPYDVAAGDVNADGRLDLLVSCESVSQQFSALDVLPGLGAGAFGAAQGHRLGRGATHLAVADMDGDGVDDAIVSVSGGGHVQVLHSIAGPWTPLVYGLAGTAGIPRLLGEGPLVVGELVRVTLRDARASAATSLVIGLSTLLLPYKGGTMVPALDVLVTPIPTDASGSIVLAAPWIEAPPGLDIWFQYWVADPAGSAGRAASNALRATVP